ncbi:hypothetical protein M0811_09594 [Anaeramoeba ignava]|uniref:Polycystin cation channel PKD1/PKD2 domain-containing protein n=1 Tax=Anaeramoeba ignava TaxID=1746090 RepID=A0A9Q0LGY0_ANAIG|nr:hypothetical protein M0811_09594 [Anaeramoeba ignava]
MTTNQEKTTTFCGFKLKPIPPKDYLTLSPWAKLIKYHRIPYKFLFRVTIFALLTAQVIYRTKHQIPFISNTESMLAEVFLPGYSSYFDTMDGELEFTVTSSHDFIQLIGDIVEQYFTFNSTVVGFFDFPRNYNGSIKCPTLTISQYSKSKFNDISTLGRRNLETTEEKYILCESNPIGPFANKSNSEMMDFMSTFHSAYLSFYIMELFPANPPVCTSWEVKTSFNYISRGGVIYVTLEPIIGQCSSSFNMPMRIQFKTSIVLIGFFIIVFSALNVILTLRTVIHEYKLYKQTKFFYEESVKNSSKSQLSSEPNNTFFRNKSEFRLAFFDFWHVFSMLSSLVNIASEIYFLLRYAGGNEQSSYTDNIFLGIACLLTLGSMTGYFQWSPKFYFMILTLRQAIPHVLRHLLGTFPIFMGYAFMGTILFGNYSQYFATIDQSFLTLFAVLNGDVIRDTFNRTYRKSGLLAVVARIYVYTFICIFMYVWLNIFITIIEASYIRAEKQRRPKHLEARHQLKKFIMDDKIEKAGIEIQTGQEFPKQEIKDLPSDSELEHIFSDEEISKNPDLIQKHLSQFLGSDQLSFSQSDSDSYSFSDADDFNKQNTVKSKKKDEQYLPKISSTDSDPNSFIDENQKQNKNKNNENTNQN